MKNSFDEGVKPDKAYQENLRMPKGDSGKEVGKHLYKGNQSVIDQCISRIDFKDGLRIVDIGCGPGYSLEQIAKRRERFEAIGIDPSDIMVEEANERIKNDERIKVVLGKTPDLPFDNNSFDYALLNNVIYFWDEPIIDLKDIYRILKDNGVLLLYMTDGKDIRSKFSKEDGIFNAYNVTQVVELLTESGFSKIDVDEIKLRKTQKGYIFKAVR